MLFSSRAFAIIILIVVLIISLIQLGVSGGIVSNFRQYGNIFSRERELSVFNIVLSIGGILISLIGLYAVIARRVTFSKVATLGCLLLALCTIGSLIAAVAINYLDVDYVSSRFSDNMNHYKDNADARHSVDLIQRNYDCCGNNMWLDWATVPLYTPSSDNSAGAAITTRTRASTTSTTTRRTTTQAAVESDWLSSTDVWPVLENTEVETIVNGDEEPQIELETTSPSTSTKLVTKPVRVTTKTTPATPRTTSKMTTHYTHPQTTKDRHNPAPVYTNQNDDPFNYVVSDSLVNALRKKRQVPTNYGSLYGLPLSYTVALPQSCCTHDSPSIFNSLDAYCISNANNAQNSFHRSGCANIITKVAISQAVGIGFINCFLIFFAFIAALVLQRTYAVVVTPPKTYRASAIQSTQVQYGGDQKDTIEKTTKTSVINYNNDYSVYQ